MKNSARHKSVQNSLLTYLPQICHHNDGLQHSPKTAQSHQTKCPNGNHSWLIRPDQTRPAGTPCYSLQWEAARFCQLQTSPTFSFTRYFVCPVIPLPHRCDGGGPVHQPCTTRHAPFLSSWSSHRIGLAEPSAEACNEAESCHGILPTRVPCR